MPTTADCFAISNRRKAMKGIGVALALLFAAYVTDQYFADGKYTDAAKRMVTQIRHSTGI
jgi:hypothetical protein